jgi:hypothetical protein
MAAPGTLEPSLKRILVEIRNRILSPLYAHGACLMVTESVGIRDAITAAESEKTDIGAKLPLHFSQRKPGSGRY